MRGRVVRIERAVGVAAGGRVRSAGRADAARTAGAGAAVGQLLHRGQVLVDGRLHLGDQRLQVGIGGARLVVRQHGVDLFVRVDAGTLQVGLVEGGAVQARKLVIHFLLFAVGTGRQRHALVLGQRLHILQGLAVV